MSDYEQWKQDYADRMKSYDFGPTGAQVLSGFVNSTASDSMANSQVYKDPTKADKITAAVGEKIGGAIEWTQNKPLIGWGVNLALNVAQVIGQYFIDPAVRTLTTGMLLTGKTIDTTSAAMDAGKNPIQFAWEQAENISPGQVLFSGMLPTGKDIFNAKKREEVFEDTWLGLVTSGGADLLFNIAGSKGTGALTRGAKTAVLGSNSIKDVGAFAGVMDDAVRVLEDVNLDATVKLSPTAQFLKEAVDNTDIAALRNNSFVVNSANPDRLATLLAGVNTPRAAADIILAERGHVPALNNLRDSLPLAHDALTDFGYDMSKPLVEWSEIHKLPDDATQYHRVIDALKQKDPSFAKQLDSFVNDVNDGRFLSNWKPGNFAAIDKLRTLPKRFSQAALIGDWNYLSPSKTGITVTERQGDRFTRGIRFFQKVQGVRSQGHINVSNPRAGESVEEILSELNRVNFLRENVDFKETAIKLYTRAADDIERAKAIGQIEQLALIEMAKKYNIDNIGEVSAKGGSINQQVDYLRKLHTDLNTQRQQAVEFLNKNGFLVDGVDGTINFYKDGKFASNFVARSTEPQYVPMLDLRRLEAALITSLDDMNKSVSGALDEFNLSPKDVAFAKLHNSQVVMGIGQFVDVANMVFSNLHLLRPAFIPKNSMLDPFMRASMALERVSGLSNGGFGEIVRGTYRNTKRRATTLPAATIRARWGQEARLLDSELADMRKTYGAAKKELDRTNKEISKVNARLERLDAEKKAIIGNDADAVAARQAIDDKIIDSNQRLNDLQVDLKANRSTYDAIHEARKVNLSKKAALLSVARDERAAMDFLGKEKFTYVDKDGNTIEVGGAFDPNAKGASAFSAEVDSYTNFFASQGMSQLGLRMREQTRTWSEIVPNMSNKEMMADYWEALSHIANRQVRQELDEVLGKLMRGDSVDDVAKWMKTTAAGREYTRRVQSRISNNSGDTILDEDLFGWLEHTQRKLFEMFPSDDLRKIILNRNVKGDEIKAYLEGYEGQLPVIYGPTTRTAFKSATKGQKFAYAAEVAPNVGWKIISRVEDKLVRMPLFRDYWKQEMQSLIKYAETNNIPVTYDLLNDAFRQQAYRRALVRVEQTLYSSRRMTNGMHAARYMMAFPAAYFNSQKVALKAMARNPYNAYWYNSVQQMMDSNMGGMFAYYEDTSTGETYEKLKDVPDGVDVSVRINLPTGVENFLREKGFDAYLDPALGGIRIPQKQLEFMIGDPSLSWIGTATLSEVIKRADLDVPVFGRVTGEKIVEGLKSTFGEDFYNNQLIFQGRLTEGENIFETLANSTVPMTYKQLFAARFGSESNAILADEANRLYRVRYRDWMAGGQDPADKPNYDDVIKEARNVLALRAFWQWNTPLSTSFDPASREATQVYGKLMQKYVGDPNQYELATDEFVSLFGKESLALLGSSNERLIGQAATLGDQKILREHRDLIGDVIANTGNVKSAAILFWANDSDADSKLTEYSSEIAAIQEQMSIPGTGGVKLTRPLTAQEIRDDIEQRVGWYEYGKLDQWRQAMMAKWGITSTGSQYYSSTGIRGKFVAGENMLREKYPAWDKDREFNRQGWYTQTGAAIETILSNQDWMQAQADTGSNLWFEVAQFMEMANAYRYAYNNSTSGDAMSIDRGNFESTYYTMLQQFSPQFGAFAARWLSNHPLLSSDFKDEVFG